MTRKLVLTNEAAQHWFRQTLPPHVSKIPAEWQPRPRKWWQREDSQLFVVSFGAFFTVFYTFIA